MTIREKAVTDRDRKILELTITVQLLKQENQALMQSITYRVATTVNQSVIEPFFPHDTRRRRYYDLGINGVRILIHEGPGSFLRQFKEKFSHKPLPIRKMHIPEINTSAMQKNDEVHTFDTCVSVIIPTKNAGPDFRYTLGKIKTQTGIKRIEIIIVDSGSSDGTVELSKKFGCRVFVVNPDNFNSGEARNFGASKSEGDYVLFTVQDAIPVGRYWVQNLVKAIENNKNIVAVTCRQIPRSDADLFACFWLYYRSSFIFVQSENQIMSGGDSFDSLSCIERMRRASLDNVTCLMRKELFEKYRFRKHESSEDLDLGLRLLKGGHHIAYLFSTGVIHSHNRDATWLFRRSYIDVKTGAGVLGFDSDESYKNTDLPDIIDALLKIYKSLKKTVYLMEESPPITAPGKKIKRVKTDVYCYIVDGNKACEEYGDGPLDDIIGTLSARLGPRTLPHESNPFISMFYNQFARALDEYDKFLSVYTSVEDKQDQFVYSLYKLLALLAGRTLGGYYVFKSAKYEPDDDDIRMLDRILRESVR
jgi:glycosyltransferase involved in cell wall biosynthesis